MNLSETVQAAQRLLAEREAVGLKKYGTTVDRTDLSPEQWLHHLIEELADGLLYALRARDTHRQRIAERAAYLVRWKGAPEDATHLAEGYDGRCWWYSREPWPNNPEPCVEWIGGLIDYAGDNLLGSVRCEPRPVQGVGP